MLEELEVGEHFMSNSNGCRTLLLVMIVAIVAGGMGFAAGFASHAIVIAAGSDDIPVAVLRTTEVPGSTQEDQPAASPTDLSPTSSPDPATEPAPAATIEIPPPRGETFDLFWEAWELIQRDYYGDLPNEEELTYGAIRGALGTLDDEFTGFIDPRVAAINREDDTGSFEGIGAYVTMRDGRLMIVNTFKDQPAERAGLRRGDFVLQVDETPVENMSIYEAISLIRGPAGEPVVLTVLREGEEPFEIEIVRARIDIPVVESEMLEDGIAYVSLFDFSSDASAKLEDALEELKQQDPTGLILDLRGNPGGWLNEAILTTGLFVPQDEVVVIERYKDTEPETLRTPNSPVVPDIPMVVLVDGGSASASEIVAGALQDHGRAILIGEQTFGKGSVQWPHELSNGAELRVTVARWFTPNDRAIHGEGLEPDIEAEMTEEDLEAELDPQLDRAIEYLLTGQ
jgi:carboxyl-terminal processing protease